MCRLLAEDILGDTEVLGEDKVAGSLGLHFVDKLTGDSGVHLPSIRHLQNVHNRVDGERDLLRMPDNIVDSVRMEAEHLPLCDRAYGLTRFGGL